MPTASRHRSIAWLNRSTSPIVRRMLEHMNPGSWTPPATLSDLGAVDHAALYLLAARVTQCSSIDPSDSIVDIWVKQAYRLADAFFDNCATRHDTQTAKVVVDQTVKARLFERIADLWARLESAKILGKASIEQSDRAPIVRWTADDLSLSIDLTFGIPSCAGYSYRLVSPPHQDSDNVSFTVFKETVEVIVKSWSVHWSIAEWPPEEVSWDPSDYVAVGAQNKVVAAGRTAEEAKMKATALGVLGAVVVHGSELVRDSEVGGHG